MRKDTLYITLSRDITSYTITSGQRAIATNVNYAVTIESPTLTTNLAGRDVSVIISDTEGNTLTTATTFYPDTKNPYKSVTGSLLLDGTVYAKFFDGKPVDTAVRLPIVIRDKSATLLSSDIVVMNGGENAEPSASDETVAGLVNAIRFYDLAEFKAWLDGTKTRDDGLMPTDIVVGQWVHTQQDGSFICKELIGAEPSVVKNFTAIVTQFPLTGTLKMNPDNGVGLSVYSGDVYNEAEATSFSTDAITYKGEAFTFNAGDNQIARQKDNYALENRVNSTMKSTLDAIRADNDETYNAMLPVMNTTVDARDRAEAAAIGSKASETRAITAEENAATSEQNAEVSKKSAAVSEANAGLYRQHALAYAQKAETEAATATTKATEASTSASEASASAGEALAHKNDAGSYAEAARLSAEASAGSAESSAASAAASKSSAETAAQSESIAVGSAAAAASSESIASQYKDTAVSASSLAVTSKDSASNFADAAAASASASASSASAAASSAAAAAQSATDLAEAVATANSLDGRILKLENGRGVYQAADGSIQIYTPYEHCQDGTLKVVSKFGKFSKILPIELADNESSLRFDADSNYLYFWIPYENRVWVYTHGFKRVAYYKKHVANNPSDFRPCYHNDRLYVCRNWYGGNISVWDKDGNLLKTSFPHISGKDDISLDSSRPAFFYNPKSGHICLYVPQPNDKSRGALVFAFDEDLNQIVEADGTYRVFEMASDEFYAMQPGIIHDTTYLFPIMGGDYAVKNCPVFRVTENDTLEIVHESIPKTDGEGNILYMTDPETGEYLRDGLNSNILLPQTEEGGEIRYNVAISDKANRPLLTAGGAFRVRPIVRYSNTFADNRFKSVTYFDGVDAYIILQDGRLIDMYSLNGVFDGTPKKLRAKNDRSTAFTKNTMRIRSCGTAWSGWGDKCIVNVLVYDAASTVPFSMYHALSVEPSGNVIRRGDILFDLYLGSPNNLEYGMAYRNGVLKDGLPSQCIFGPQGWVTDYNKIIRGEY